MEKETSIFKAEELRLKEEKTSIVAKFNEIAEFVKEKYGANIWFVKILGKRHSYIAGYREESFFPPEVVYLNERYAIVSDDWERIGEKEEILSMIKILIPEENHL